MTVLKFVRREGEHLARRVVQIEQPRSWLLARDQGPQTLYHFGRPVPVSQRALRCRASAFEVGGSAASTRKQVLALVDDALQRLLDLMGVRIP